jgi:hypothetical protein
MEENNVIYGGRFLSVNIYLKSVWSFTS